LSEYTVRARSAYSSKMPYHRANGEFRDSLDISFADAYTFVKVKKPRFLCE